VAALGFSLARGRWATTLGAHGMRTTS